MPDRRRMAGIAAIAIVCIASTAWMLVGAKGKDMRDISFDLGKDIVETARATGAPKFPVDKVDGLITYSLTPVPAGVALHFTHPGLEIAWEPVFAFSLDADEKMSAGRRTDTASLQLDSRFATHAAAQEFAARTLAQFRKGQWKRYQDPEWDTLLSGRSSLLDEQGQIADPLMNADPAYAMAAQDWITAAHNGIWWRFVGDGIYAEFVVHADPDRAGAAPSYSMDLKFVLLDVKQKVDADNHAREMRQGDAKGWNSTAQYESGKKERQALIKRLEANALRRGDAVLTPH